MEFTPIGMRDANRSSQYLAIAHETYENHLDERRKARREYVVWSATSVLAGASALLSEEPIVLGFGMGLAVSIWRFASGSSPHAYDPLIRSHGRVIEDRLKLYYDPERFTVRAGNEASGLEAVVDARDFKHPALELDERPVLLTRPCVERVGEAAYTRIGDTSFPIHAFEGDYPWLIVRRVEKPYGLVPLVSPRRAERS